MKELPIDFWIGMIILLIAFYLVGGVSNEDAG